MIMNTDIHYHGPVVALDLDDTLYPEADYVASAYDAIADALLRRDNINAAASLKVMNRAFRIGHNPFEALLDAFPSIGFKELFIPMCVEIYRYHTPKISLPEESREFLTYLRDNGIRAAIVTDGRAVTQWSKIKALSLDEFINPADIWISEERGIGKLALNPWRALVNRYPEASSFFAIGDNPAKDFLYPNMLGFTTICLIDKGRNVHPQNDVPSAAHAPAHRKHSFREIESLIISAPKNNI